MKKNLSLIYRLSFIIFTLWGLLEYMGYSFKPKSLLGFTPLVDILCLICITVIFIFSLKNFTKKFMVPIKGMCTLLSVILLILNANILFNFFTYGWITGVLLPIMMIVDWLVFDNKGDFTPRDLLLCLAILLGLLLLLNFFFGDVPWLSDIISFLRNPENLARLLAGLLGAALIMYLLDALLGGGFGKKSEMFNSTILRLIFLVIEACCFINIAAFNLGKFITSLKFYSLFINFLCFLCIAVMVLRGIFIKNTKNATLFTRIKLYLTIGAVLLPLFFGVYQGIVLGDELIGNLLCIVCPLLMVLDCLLFDKNDSYETYDPCIALSIPLVHFVLTYFILRPLRGLTTYTLVSGNPIALFGISLAAALVAGYILYAINKLKK